MPNIKSQKKRVITNQKANERNTAERTRVRNAVKKVDAAIAAADVAAAEVALKEAISLIDIARHGGLIKDNTASRKISRLTKAVNSIKA